MTQGHLTTAESYGCALKSFKRVLWNTPVKGFDINYDVLKRWEYGMLNGVKGEDGKMTRPIAEATTGIYKRTCRLVWKECQRLGYLTNVEYPFSNKKEAGKIYIPKGKTRKDRNLTIEKMTELYNFFMNPTFPETWKTDYCDRAYRSLGMFLVQYLGNGLNLADAILLKYDQYYFASDQRAFHFERKKTKDRSRSAEVVIPIIKPLQNVLDKIAAKPELDKPVFPWLFSGEATPRNIRNKTSNANSNIQDHVSRIAKEILGREMGPSGTWARHSFGNNLRNAGVDMDYISECMGHSTQDHPVTQLYIDNYPLDKKMEYNSLLLNVGNEEKNKKEALLSQLASLNADELQELLNKARKK